MVHVFVEMKLKRSVDEVDECSYPMMSHIGFGTIQNSLEFQPIGISICYHITYLANNRCKYEHTD